MQDRIIGALLVSVSVVGVVYYTMWVLILPFFSNDHPVHSMFPPITVALLIPALLGLAFIGSLVVLTVAAIHTS